MSGTSCCTDIRRTGFAHSAAESSNCTSKTSASAETQTKNSVAKWEALGEGDIDWPAIYAALRDIGYKGTATVELEGGDAGALKEICRRLNLILTGEMPSGAKPAHG